MRSLYLLSLSTCTVFISKQTLFFTGDFDPTPREQINLSTVIMNSTFTKCGSKNPSTFCLDTGGSNLTDMDFFAESAIGGFFLLAILALLMLDYCEPQFAEIFAARDTIDACRNFFYLIIWTVYQVSFLTFLMGLQNPLAITSTGTSFIVEDWTFGQIVAIAVWASPIFEFMKLSIRDCQPAPLYMHAILILTYFGTEGLK